MKKDNLTTNAFNEAESPAFLVGAVMGSVCPECKSEMKNTLQESWYGDTIVHFECNCGKKIIMIDCHPRCNYSVKREMKFDRDSICHEKTLRHGWL